MATEKTTEDTTNSKTKKKKAHRTDTYASTPNGMFLETIGENGDHEYTRLTNFTARIIREYNVTDGIRRNKMFDLEVTLVGDVAPVIVRVTAEAFVSPKTWVIPLLGARAIVYPGWQREDIVRTAIQELSGVPPVLPVYTHTGWCKITDQWYFLHAGGAIGPDPWGDQPDPNCPTSNLIDSHYFGDAGAMGAILSVKAGASQIGVQYGDILSKYRLPAPYQGVELVKAVEASLKMLDLAPDTITMPLYAAVWRAPIGGSTYSVYLDGATGSGKSVLAALAQQHFGAAMNYENLPASFSSTANALEGLAFLLKDVAVVMDDWLPRGSQSDIQRSNRDADRVFRAQGNHSGRLRSNRDGTPMGPRPPRGLIIATGEAMPEGQSLNARCFRIEVQENDVLSPNKCANLSDRQRDADAGLYAAAMAAYIRWLSEDLDDNRTLFLENTEYIREMIRAKCKHPRTASIIAELGAAFHLFLDFATEMDIISQDENDKLWDRFSDAMLSQIKDQGWQLEVNDPATQFCDYLGWALLSGRAHVAQIDGTPPEESPTAWGWKKRTWQTPKEEPKEPLTTETDAEVHNEAKVTEYDEHHSFEAQGPKVGWIIGDNLYLLPAPAFKAAQDIAAACNQRLALTPRSLGKHLHQRGMLVMRDEYRKSRYTRRVHAEGRRPEVYHLHDSSVIRPEFHGTFWLDFDYDGPGPEVLFEAARTDDKLFDKLLEC